MQGLMMLVGLLLLFSANCQLVQAAAKQQVVLIQDGGVPDDYMGAVLLLKAENIELLGDVVVTGDSFAPWNMHITDKIHYATDRDGQTPIGLSAVRGFNAFPIQWRRDVARMAALKSLSQLPHRAKEPYRDGDLLLAEILQQAADGSVSIVSTAGITTLASVLKQQPSLRHKVKQLVWGAGAVDVPGNLDQRMFSGFNTCAEWNVFWDVEAVEYIFASTAFPIYLLPLDISDQADPHKFPGFLQALGAANTTLGAVAYESYSMVLTNQPWLRLWDLVTAGYLAQPSLYKPAVLMNLTVGTKLDSAHDYGCTYLSNRSELPSGSVFREVQVVSEFSKGASGFLQYVTTAFSQAD